MHRVSGRVSQRVAREDGFTVFEFVAASLILFVVLMGVLGAVEYAGAASRMSAIRQGAIDVATTQIEYARNLPWDSIGVKYANGWFGDPPGTIPATTTVTTARGTYSVATSIWWARDTSVTSAIRVSYKRVRIKVSWTKPTAGSVAVETNMFGKSTTGNTGMVQLNCRDVDAPATALSGIRIVLKPSTGATIPVAESGTDGLCIWNNVPTGQASWFDPAPLNPDWLVDIGKVNPPFINSGFQDLGFVYCQRPSTARIHVHSVAVEDVSGAKVTLIDKDRNITYTAFTGDDGYAYFDSEHGLSNSAAGLWKSGSQGYTAVATYGAASSETTAFMIPESGKMYERDLALPEPPTIVVSKKVSTTNSPLNGVPWSCTVKNPAGTTVGTYSGTAANFTVAAASSGNYTVTVTGVPGYQDTTYTFNANNYTVGQQCVVPMTPRFTVAVILNSNVASPWADAVVTVKNVATGVSATSAVTGLTYGVTGVAGTASFSIPGTGTYSVSALVNNISYNASSNVALEVMNPPSNPTTISVPVDRINMTFKYGSGSWWRYAAVWDGSGNLVFQSTITRSPLFVTPFCYLPPGNYYVAGGGGTNHYAPADPMPASTSYYVGYTNVWKPPITSLPAGGGSTVNVSFSSITLP